MPERPLGPPEDPDRFDDFEECVTSLMENEDLDREDAERICGAWENQTNAMTDHDGPQHRAFHHPDADDIVLRELGDGKDGLFSVRMPLASTGEVRNEGDDPLTRDEVDGMRQQIAERAVGVFLDHGANMEVSGSRYSATGKVGEWAEPELVENDAGETLLEADARLMDPETLPAAAGAIREALAALKSQVERDLSLAASIGWRDDESMPGGVDLMEASIVGIPADPRTTSQDAAAALARHALAADPERDREQLVEQFRTVVMGSDPTDTHDMSESDDTDASGDEPDDTNDDQDGISAEEFRSEMLELQREQMETLETVASAVREDDEDDDEDDGDDDDEDEDMETSSDDGGEASEESDEERTLTVDGEEIAAEQIRAMREQLEDAEPEQPGDDADDDAEQREHSDTTDTTDDLLSPR